MYNRRAVEVYDGRKSMQQMFRSTQAWQVYYGNGLVFASGK